jgi:hypothetical protein
MGVDQSLFNEQASETMANQDQRPKRILIIVSQIQDRV